MKGFVLLAATIGALVLAPSSGGAIVLPVDDGKLTIGAQPNPIIFGEATTISGKLSGSLNSESAVTLEANPAPFTAGFQTVAATNTDANGNYSFGGVKPELNTRYRTVGDGCVAICPLCAERICPLLETVIICPIVQSLSRIQASPPIESPLPCGGGTVSPELLVEVRLKVTLHVSERRGQGGRVRFFGGAAPAHNGLTVAIQRRRRSGRWVDVAHATLKNSRFSRSFVPRPGRYRARIDHDADHADGTSRTVRITR